MGAEFVILHQRRGEAAGHVLLNRFVLVYWVWERRVVGLYTEIRRSSECG